MINFFNIDQDFAACSASCTLYGVLLNPQTLLMAAAHASTVFPLHTQNPEVIPTAKTMKCFSISTEKSGEVRRGRQSGQSRDLSHLKTKVQKNKNNIQKHKKYKEWEIPRERGCLIEAARNDSSGGDDVEDGEDPDLHHQLLQLVNLGPTLLFLDNAPDQACFSQRDRGRNNLILKSEMNPAERKETPRIR